MESYMYKKINVAILLISICLVFIFIFVYVEHTNSKRKENALRYYNQIIPIITLADVLDADLEYSDNYGNKGILKGREGNLTRRVSDDIMAYITKQNNHMYEYRIIESESILKYIGNFNNNMKNIRISRSDMKDGCIVKKTISEGEGLGEFHECNDLSALIDYMSSKTADGEYFIEALDVIGVNGSDIPGRIVYILGDGTEKVMYENDTLNLAMLFKDNSR